MIKDLADLAKLLKLCRKQGIKDIKLGDMSITFGEEPRARGVESEPEVDEPIPTDEPTIEQLMFLSAGGAHG